MARASSNADRAVHCTYRLQLRPGFGFDQAAELVDYLAELGVSHVYLSPYLQAAAGSTHGYDVVDHSRINEELGGAAAHQRLCEALAARGLGQVIDLVPSHMCVASAANRWWWDVLENGPDSQYAEYFDIYWDSPEPHLKGKVTLPVLGDHLWRVLEAGQIRLVREQQRLLVRVYDRALPVAPNSLQGWLARAGAAGDCEAKVRLAACLDELARRSSSDRASRQRCCGQLREAVTEALREQVIVESIDRELALAAQQPTELNSWLEQQHYRLTYWRTARHELNYRRFFDISELACLRMEDEQVFQDTHRLILELVERGQVDGIRVDHPDGLRDPEQYFMRLRARAPQAWIVAEKILEPGEQLPDSWPIHGTTGYDLLNQLGGLFVDDRAEAQLSRIYLEFTGEVATDFSVLVREAKRQVLDQLLQADLGRLVQRAYEFATLERQWGDFTRPQMYAALQHVIASLPVYRTYVRSGQAARTVDEGHLVAAIEQARRDCVELDATLSAFLRELLTGRIPCAAAQQLVAAFQQLSGPAMAKGLEDTAFYRYVRLLSLNEVGGDPGRFGVSVDAFHRFCAQLQRDWPLSMVCTSTHDTKRSEDVRSRISLLSEMPERWESLLHRLSELARGHRDGSLVDGPTEYLFWQTLVGAWPISTERMTSYLLKAVREAKRRTSWTRADQKYEDAILQYARRVLSDPKIVAELSEFVREIEGPARRASLAQLLLKLSAPGVPDIYQGTELWELSLVDPDNRRAVDFATRRRLLAELAHLSCAEVLARSHEGLPKLFVTYHALRLRRRRPECFGAAGAYRPLRTRGRHADRVVAFARGDKVASIAPRLLLGLHDGWGDTTVELPAGQFVSVFCGGPPVAGRVRVSALLEQFPVALLEEVDAQ